MTIEWRSALILFVTLATGALLGVLGGGALQDHRRNELAALRGPVGFVGHLESIIQPRDSAQRTAIDAELAITGQRNAALLAERDSAMRAELVSLEARLAPILDAEQRTRLSAFARRPPPVPGGAPPDDRPPPPGQGPPDGRGPPPGGPPPR